MARSSRFNIRPQMGRSNRAFTWIGGVNTASAAVSLAAGASTLVSGFDTRAAGPPFTPFTIVRARGFLKTWTDQEAADEAPWGAYGLAVVNGEAFDAGIASIPTPFTESGDGRWFYHTYWSAPCTIISGSLAVDFDKTLIDNKAMRKVKDGDVIVAVIENGSSAHGNLYLENFRLGVKLH